MQQVHKGSKLAGQQNLQTLLENFMNELWPLTKTGKLASYIPALEKAKEDAFGACLITLDGTVAKYGDYLEPYTMQSISKVFSFICCLLDSTREQLYERISLEPSPNSFNAIADLETHATRKPLNPMINAGAIAVLELVSGKTATEKYERIRGLVRLLCGNDNLDYNDEVYRSEQETGDRNRSLAYYMRSNGIIEGNVDSLLEVYFKLCAIDVTCEDLAKAAAVLANNGVGADGKALIPPNIVNATRTVMALCGMYNESGRYAVQVGIPSKSGVGGGIVGVVPNVMGISIFSPALNEHGSSVCGYALMKRLSDCLGLSVF